MRVVGGEYRGRKLVAPEGAATRPTAERVREALFDILGSGVEGAAFGDLFAGTGAVGIEALSRGASHCVFVESYAKALRCLERNLDLVGAGGRSRILSVVAARALAILEEEGSALDVLFCDPPYADPRWPELLAGLGGRSVLAHDGWLVVEHAIKTPPACPAGLAVRRSYKYGDTGLTVFVKTELGDQGTP
jgi:16S rRNA (guanine966-N2)-methyltransferase